MPTNIFSVTGGQMLIRPCDPAGCGYFGATRTNHIHHGSDIVVTPGQNIYAPISGKVRRLFVYPNSSSMTGVEIKNNKVGVKIFYLNVDPNVGKYISAGDYLGTAQNVSAYYNRPDMTPHIHVEVREHGKLIDPALFFKDYII